MKSIVQIREPESSLPGQLSILIIESMEEAGPLEQEAAFMGHISTAVFSYRNAIKKIKENSFDLIIMNMDLQDGDWLSTLKTVRKMLGNVHIITMTGSNSREIEELAREHKVIYYIVKPLDIKEMSSVINHISMKKLKICLKQL